MENTTERKGEHDSEIPEKVESKKISIEELAIQLEIGSVRPNGIDKKTKRDCIKYYKIKRDYTCRTIAEILNLRVRTVQRYTKRMREENTMNLDLYWQKNIIGEFLNKCKTENQRLKRLLYIEKLSPNDVMRITKAQHKIEMDCINVLEKTGYLSKAISTVDVNTSIVEDQAEEERLKKSIDRAYENYNNIKKEWEKYKIFQGSPEEKDKLREAIRQKETHQDNIIDAMDEMLYKFENLQDKKKYKYADKKMY